MHTATGKKHQRFYRTHKFISRKQGKKGEEKLSLLFGLLAAIADIFVYALPFDFFSAIIERVCVRVRVRASVCLCLFSL